MKTLFVHLSFLLIFLSGCGGGGGGGSAPQAPGPAPAVSSRVQFAGAGDLGIFDPSVSVDPATGRLWMSYSSVETSRHHPSSTYWAVSIRLAFSDDNGNSWQDAGVAVGPASEPIVGPMTAAHPSGNILAGSKGLWQSETSSLVYDPSAPPSERWKVIWHQYLNANLTSYFVDYAWIAMKTAATPLGLGTATPVKLFGGFGLQGENTMAGAPVFSPIGGAPLIQLNLDLTKSLGGAALTELNQCIFAEPGLHATSSAVYLAIYCADASTAPSITEYVVYFRCVSPCTMTSAASWEYLGRLLSPTDALAATGNHHFQAPALLEKGGKTYLIVTPVDTTVGDRYNGCRAYEFTDIDTNQLRRSGGILVEVARVDGDAGTHHGACEFHSGLNGGILLSQFGVIGTADAFKIEKSQVVLP